MDSKEIFSSGNMKSNNITDEELVSLVSSWWEREGQHIYPWGILKDLNGNVLYNFGGTKENNTTIYEDGN